MTLVDALLAGLLPMRCPGCRARRARICAVCEASFRPAPPAPPPSLVDWWTACFAYEGVAREIVARAKYRGERAVLHGLGHRLVVAARDAPAPIDVVTWAPASASRLAATGVDHAAVVARVLARELGLPARALLRRDNDAPQTGRDLRSRRQGPRVRITRPPRGLTVLVVDDVATTGGTLTAAARALRAHGARAVFAATIARTPPPGEARAWLAYTSVITRY